MFVFVVALLVIGLNTAMAQPNQGSIHFAANVVATPLTLTAAGNNVQYDGLTPGTCYQTVADPTASATNITPSPGGAVTFNPEEIDLAGDANGEVTVHFILPSRLFPVGSGLGFVDVTYGNQSAAVADLGSGSLHFFNPTNDVTMSLDGAGVGTLFLGGDVCVSANATLDSYEGDALVVADYTGVSY